MKDVTKDHKQQALSSKTDLRRRARERLDDGAVTDAYAADRTTVIALLNTALASEIVCVLRYKRHYFMAVGIHSESVAAEFSEHAAEEQAHADRIATRITQLGGEPDLDPAGLKERSQTEYVAGANLVDMLREDLIAERIAIESYSEAIRYVGAGDPTTRRMLEEILADEEDHADDLANLLESFDRTD